MIVPRLVRESFLAMGTECAIAVSAVRPEAPYTRRALAAARLEVEACERVLSRFRPESDLSRLNAAAGAWVEVDERLVDVLRVALRARDDTGGRFDPTILAALAAAGYDRSFEHLDERPPSRLPSWRPDACIELDAASRRARVEAGALVDLGGIGKGFAAARALSAMREVWPGLPGGLVDLGGDIAVGGVPPEGGPWRISVEDPRAPGASLATLAIRGGAVASSGRNRRRFGPGGRLHHLIDPATGAPAEAGPLAVTVVGDDAAEVEAYATALAVAGLDEARACLAGRPDLSALFTPVEGSPTAIGGLPLATTARTLEVVFP